MAMFLRIQYTDTPRLYIAYLIMNVCPKTHLHKHLGNVRKMWQQHEKLSICGGIKICEIKDCTDLEESLVIAVWKSITQSRLLDFLVWKWKIKEKEKREGERLLKNNTKCWKTCLQLCVSELSYNIFMCTVNMKNIHLVCHLVFVVT